jgi:hypothetical protein
MPHSHHCLADPVGLLTRRGLLQFGGASGLGLTLGGLWRAQANSSVPAVAPKSIRSCILIFYYGGPSHLDTFDLKPNAPQEVRGEFKPIATSVPGVQVCEYLPRMARLMHKVALVRSMHHAARLHDSASIHALTGRPLEGADRELFSPIPQFYPSFGSAVTYLRRDDQRDVSFASLPYAFHNVVTVPCQGAGFLGAAYEPLRIDADAINSKYQVEMLRRTEGVDHLRSADRRSLLARLERADAEGDPRKGLYERAYRLLDAKEIGRALDIEQEPLRVRERYGLYPSGRHIDNHTTPGGPNDGVARHMRGQNLLLARRLVEAGVPFVNVYDYKQQGLNWDTHAKNFAIHKDQLLPPTDRALSALIEDLDARGLLDTTLVVAMGEFGRTPRINANAGRDHWPDCYTVLLAGGGVHGGAVHGSSDSIGAYPAADPVTPGDLAATKFWRLGLDAELEIRELTGRPHRLAEGRPLRQLFRQMV